METGGQHHTAVLSKLGKPGAAMSSPKHLVGAAGLTLAAVCALAVGIGFQIDLANAASLHLFSVSLWFWLQWAQHSSLCQQTANPSSPDGRADAMYVMGGAQLAVLVASGYLFVTYLGVSQPPAITSGRMLAVIFALEGIVWLFLSHVLVPPFVAGTTQGYGKVLLREAEWSAFLVAAGIFAGDFSMAIAQGITVALLLWVALISLEGLVRNTVFLSYQRHSKPMDRQWAALSGARSFFFSGQNPARVLLAAIDRRAGSTTKTAWAMQTIRTFFLPVVILTVLAGWLSSAIRVVSINEMALEERYGIIAKEPLGPGIHLVLPWPMGRLLSFPVKQIATMTVGFATTESFLDDKALLWTKAHSGEEFALALGNGTELVVVNALLYYKIAETPEGLLQYAVGWQNALDALGAFAYRTLMEETRTKTLDAVLSEDREDFTRGIERRVRDYVEKSKLGIEVVALGLISLHPPVPVASAYLDVINARFEARRAVTEARGEAAVAEQKAETQRNFLLAKAQQDALKMTSLAAAQGVRFASLAAASRSGGEVFMTRLLLEGQEETLMERPLVVVDRAFSVAGGELWLDLRNTAQPTLSDGPTEAPQGPPSKEKTSPEGTSSAKEE